VDPAADPLLLRKFGSAGNRTRDLWVSGPELSPLDQRGGPTVVHIQRTKIYLTSGLLRCKIRWFNGGDCEE
jgi:hypothetical protein